LNIFIKKYSKPKYPNTLYLDKDGVLNKAIKRYNKISSPRTTKEILIKDDLKDIFQFSQKKKFNLVLISNQPDLSRGLISINFLIKNLKLIRRKIPICFAFFCPHLKSRKCNCRKPKTGLIEKYRKLYPKNIKKEIFIGDQITDQNCALKANVSYIHVANSFSKFNLIKNKLKKF